jgi:hypothetical protein
MTNEKLDELEALYNAATKALANNAPDVPEPTFREIRPEEVTFGRHRDVPGAEEVEDQAFCAAVWDALKGDHNDLRRQQIILKAHRAALDAARAELAEMREAAARARHDQELQETWDAARAALAKDAPT